MKKFKIWGILLIVSVCFIVGGFIFFEENGKSYEKAHAHYINSPTPMLFLHGTSGTLNSFHYLIQQAEDRGVTQDVLIAHVSSEGDVTFEGDLSKDADNPIVQIELEDNDNMDLNANAKWIKNVLTELQAQYHIKDFNFVGHSMGNTSFAQYMINYGKDKTLPHLKKQVSIAGTYNGVLGQNEDVNEITVDKNGKPSRMIPPYQGFRKLKDVYQGQNIEVLNIYGDLLDGTNSDRLVSESSAKSLKYLLDNSPKSYKELRYEGENAEHSALHDNQDVANDILPYLWGKQRNTHAQNAQSVGVYDSEVKASIT